MLKVNLDGTIYNFALLFRNLLLSILKLPIPVTGGTVYSFRMFWESLKYQMGQETVFECSTICRKYILFREFWSYLLILAVDTIKWRGERRYFIDSSKVYIITSTGTTADIWNRMKAYLLRILDNFTSHNSSRKDTTCLVITANLPHPIPSQGPCGQLCCYPRALGIRVEQKINYFVHELSMVRPREIAM